MEPLSFNVKLMKTFALWPQKFEKSSSVTFLIKHVLVLLTLAPSGITSLLGMARQLRHLEEINILIDQFIGICALVACVYMCECFVRSIQNVRDLTDEIANFGKKFNAQEILDGTEKRIQTYTKGILIYGVVGNICYALFPLITASKCEETRKSVEIYEKNDPCGLVVRVWYPFDISQFPLFYVAYLIQMYTCVIVSVLVLTITMLLVGLLMYAVALLKHCGHCIEICCDEDSQEQIAKNVNFCIRYHIAIILYSSNITEAFSSMMLVHITLTSFQVSILGFEIIMVDSLTDSFRFAMHLYGWLLLLFLVCFYGQNLIDESTKIAVNVYSSSWEKASVSVQKDLQLITLRSQKPLTLSAASLGIMSLETYLGVISTAYSYFTLLVNIKDD